MTDIVGKLWGFCQKEDQRVRSQQAVAQTNHLPFDRLSLPAEQGLWHASGVRHR